MPRTCEAASWEPNDVYDELRHAGFSGCSEEDHEETFNRFLKPAAPPDSGNGVVVPHEAPPQTSGTKRWHLSILRRAPGTEWICTVVVRSTQAPCCGQGALAGP